MTTPPATDRLHTTRTGRTLTVSVSGELDLAIAPEVIRIAIEQHRSDDEQVRLDLSGVTFCDSSGTRAIFRLHHALDGNDGRFVLLNPAPAVSRVLDLVDPDQLVAVQIR